jgi:hypothetical protein
LETGIDIGSTESTFPAAATLVLAEERNFMAKTFGTGVRLANFIGGNISTSSCWRFDVLMRRNDLPSLSAMAVTELNPDFQ